MQWLLQWLLQSLLQLVDPIDWCQVADKLPALPRDCQAASSAAERETAAFADLDRGLRQRVVLGSLLDAADFAAAAQAHALRASPGPIIAACLPRVMQHHHEKGLLPRHFAVRPESFK
jgi:hypothetical protein